MGTLKSHGPKEKKLFSALAPLLPFNLPFVLTEMFTLAVIVAVLAIIAQGASEVVNSHSLHVKAAEESKTQAIDAQKEIMKKVMNHFGIDGSTALLEAAPRSLRHTERKLGGAFYTSITSYYQGQMFLDSNNQATCSTTGTPIVGIGVGMGCYSFPNSLPPGVTPPSGMPQSVQMTCAQGDAGSITMAAVMWSGSNCDGSVINIPNAGFNQVMPACSQSNGYMWQTCAGTSTTGPASLYNGYRTTTYLNSDVCMGSPYSYYDFYNSASQTYTCDAGNIYEQTPGLSQKTVVLPVTCTATSSIPDPTDPSLSFPMSIGSGCISASSSVSVRTYQQWQMTQTINGVSADTWKSSPANTISAVAAFADLYGINYEFISAISFVPAGSNAANIVYTVRVQPGYGNDYTTQNVYNSLVTIAQNAVNTNTCDPVISTTNPNPNPCLANLIMNRGVANGASSAIQSSLSLPAGGGFLGATQPQIVTTGQPSAGGGGTGGGGTGGGDTSSNGATGGGSNAGAIVGALFAVAIVCGAIYYYQYVYLKAATDAAAKSTFDADSVKNPVSIGATVAPAAPSAILKK